VALPAEALAGPLRVVAIETDTGGMQKPTLDRMWETFLRLDVVPTEPPEAAGAIAMLRHVREKLLPLVRQLERDAVIDWYCYVLHGRASGVPTTEDDQNVYIHLRVTTKSDVTESRFLAALPSEWLMTRRIVAPECREISGLDRSVFREADIERAWWLIGEQAEWMLALIEQHDPGVEDLQLIQHTAQFLHYFANMTQLRIA
jgi:hypothetical protein